MEDDSGDVDLLREAMKSSRARVSLHVVDDGGKAVRYIRRQAPYTGEARPDLVLLDLNLPTCGGREVLQEIKGDASLRMIPVVILSTSGEEQEVARSYRQGANCYVTKPLGLSELMRVVRAIESFWFTIVRLPSLR